MTNTPILINEPPVEPPTPPNNITLGVKQLFGIFFGILLIGMVAFWLGGRQTKSDLETHRKQVETYIKESVVPTLRESDSLRTVNIQLNNERNTFKLDSEQKTIQITSLQRTVQTLRVQNKKLTDSVFADTTLPPACDQCKRALAATSSENDSLVTLVAVQEQRDSSRVKEISTLGIMFNNAQRSADSLSSVIRNYPLPPKPAKFLGITLPKIPPQYLVIGGVVIGVVISRD